MEKFLLITEPSKLSISGAIYRQMLEDNWTGVRDVEVERFIKAYCDILNNITSKRSKNKSDKRIEKLQSFGDNEDLLRKRVEEQYDELMSLKELSALNIDTVIWREDAKGNIDSLIRNVPNVATKAESNEKVMWKEISKELRDIKEANIGNLPYDHPLCSGVLDSSSEPFVNSSMSESTRNIFQKPIEKYNINDNEPIKRICNNFMKEETSSHRRRLFSSRFETQDMNFGEFIDTPDDLCRMTEDMLKVLANVWRLPKYERLSDVNEGSYVCEVLSPLLNIALNKFPVEQSLSGIWGEKVSIASAMRKGKYGRKPDFSLVVQIDGQDHEIFYLETGTPISKLDKQLRDHRKLVRFSKDSIDQIRNVLKKFFQKISISRDSVTIFTMNVTGNKIKVYAMNKESGCYKYRLITEATIPLQIKEADANTVYKFIHALLTLRTAIVCTLGKISYYSRHGSAASSVVSDTDTGVSMESIVTNTKNDDDETFQYQTVSTPDSTFYK